jgi:replicative DNA helicase
VAEILEPKPPASQRAEESVISALLRKEEVRLEILGSGLDSDVFYYRPYKLLYDVIVERYYGDDPIDPLSVAESVGPQLAEMWNVSEREAIDKVIGIASTSFEGSPAEHAKIIRDHHAYGQVITAAADAMSQGMEQQLAPDEIAAQMSAAAMRIVTGTLMHAESYSYVELGRRWTKQKAEEIEARAAGIELGARYGIKAVDDFVKGQRPGELFVLGGDPGVGKSALAWAMARNFAVSQMKRQADQRLGTLVMSLEMGEEQSSSRFAQAESKVPGEKLREGDLTRAELREIAAKWARNRELPIWVNHSGELRETQLKAIITDHVRRHNVGVVIIDHFRFIKTDERYDNKNDADEEIVKFLKANLAKDLNLAIVCLAHTTKMDDRRPEMDDLRGSKMISAFADIVAFPYSSWAHLSESERERGMVARQDFELLFRKVRESAPGVGELYMDLSTQTIR